MALELVEILSALRGQVGRSGERFSGGQLPPWAAGRRGSSFSPGSAALKFQPRLAEPRVDAELPSHKGNMSGLYQILLPFHSSLPSAPSHSLFPRIEFATAHIIFSREIVLLWTNKHLICHCCLFLGFNSIFDHISVLIEPSSVRRHAEFAHFHLCHKYSWDIFVYAHFCDPSKSFHADKTALNIVSWWCIATSLRDNLLRILRGPFKGRSGSLVSDSTSNRNLSENGIQFNPQECSREEQVVPKHCKLNLHYTPSTLLLLGNEFAPFPCFFSGALWLRHIYILWHL